MFESTIALVLLVALVVLPFALRIRRDRRQEEALALQARLQAIANQRLGGESYLVVSVEPGPTGHRGRVLLSAPERWHWLIDEVWKDVLAATPATFDLVVRGEARERPRVPRPVPVARHA